MMPAATTPRFMADDVLGGLSPQRLVTEQTLKPTGAGAQGGNLNAPGRILCQDACNKCYDVQHGPRRAWTSLTSAG
jgi:hypothetical protein